MNTAVAMKESPNELDVFADRFFHFLNVWTVYRDLAKGKYAPSIDMEEPSVQVTMMFILCAFFHGLVEDSDDGLNGFRVWRKRLPREEAAIAAVEAKVQPLLGHLRMFRNRLGFPGSRTRSRESAAFDLLDQQSRTEILEAMKRFKSMSAALFGMDTALRTNDSEKIARYRKKLDEIAVKK